MATPNPSPPLPASPRVGFVSRILPYNLLLTLTPWKTLLLSWLVGISLVVFSLWLGCGRFLVTVQIYPSGESTPMPLDPLELGYAIQLNYGCWYVIPIFCPAVFFLCSFIFHSSQKSTPKVLDSACNFARLAERNSISAIGILLLVFFVGMSLYVERQQYGHLALGWVQSEQLAKEGLKARTDGKPVDIQRRSYAFKVGDKLVHAKRVQLVSVEPADFHIRSHRGFLAFIVLAKAWSGLWEGMVVYVAVLLIAWGIGVVRSVTPESIRLNTDGQAGIAWTKPVAIPVLFLGIETNLFVLARFVANASKGSFGKWDQYWSLLILLPPLILLIVAGPTLFRVIAEGFKDFDKLATRFEIGFSAVWATLFLYVCLIIMGFLDPPAATMLMMLRHLLGSPAAT